MKYFWKTNFLTLVRFELESVVCYGTILFAELFQKVVILSYNILIYHALKLSTYNI